MPAPLLTQRSAFYFIGADMGCFVTTHHHHSGDHDHKIPENYCYGRSRIDMVGNGDLQLYEIIVWIRVHMTVSEPPNEAFWKRLLAKLNEVFAKESITVLLAGGRTDLHCCEKNNPRHVVPVNSIHVISNADETTIQEPVKTALQIIHEEIHSYVGKHAIFQNMVASRYKADIYDNPNRQ